MKIATNLMIATALSLAACAQTPPPAASSPKEASQSAAAKPEVAAAKVHLEQHETYPANRKEILAACEQFRRLQRLGALHLQGFKGQREPEEGSEDQHRWQD